MSDVLSPALHSQVEDSGRRERIAVACVRDILNPMTRDDWFLLSLDELTIVAKACFDAAMASVPGWLREEGMPAYLGVLLAIGRTRREEVAHRGMGYVNLRGAPVYDLSAFVRLMSATRIFHYKALGTIADVLCDAPLEDISLKVCFRTLRASSSLRWYEQELYKFSSDLTFTLREAELRREGALRSRATEWLRGKLGASGASFTEAFADNELTGGYTVDIVIGDPSNKHGVLVAPRNACYRSHLDGRRDRAPMVTQLNVAALKKLGWKVGIIYEALLEPAKSTQNLSDDTGMTSELRKAGVLPTEE